eukprot:scaffold135451_cov32-Tisochrysis_lutea.AAC.1
MGERGSRLTTAAAARRPPSPSALQHFSANTLDTSSKGCFFVRASLTLVFLHPPSALLLLTALVGCWGPPVPVPGRSPVSGVLSKRGEPRP